MRDEKEILNRWRLALGRYSDGAVGFTPGKLPYEEMDQVLDFLYSREYGEDQDIRKERRGGTGASELTVPSWIEKLRRLNRRNHGAPCSGKIWNDRTSHRS